MQLVKSAIKVGLSRFSTGFKDFERTLEAAGVLKRIGITTAADFKRSAEQTQNRMPSLFHHFVVPLKYILSGRLFLERPLGIGHGIARNYEMMKQGWHSILRPGVQGNSTSFIGGKPCLPPSIPLPVCNF